MNLASIISQCEILLCFFSADDPHGATLASCGSSSSSSGSNSTTNTTTTTSESPPGESRGRGFKGRLLSLAAGAKGEEQGEEEGKEEKMREPG